jgi:hypothetical protein
VLPIAAINRWGIAKLVPADGDISYEDLAKATGVSESILQRTLRHAMTSRLFCEKGGKVAHTPTSKLLVENEYLAAFVDLHTEVAFKSLSHTMDALEKWPDSTSPREVGYSIAVGNPGEISVYEDLAKDPARTVNFGRAMQFFSSGEGYEVTSLVEGYPWGKLGKGTVVDVSVLAVGLTFKSIEKFTGWRCKRVCKRRNLKSIPGSETHRARYPNGRRNQGRLPRNEYQMDAA